VSVENNPLQPTIASTHPARKVPCLHIISFVLFGFAFVFALFYHKHIWISHERQNETKTNWVSLDKHAAVGRLEANKRAEQTIRPIRNCKNTNNIICV
jgi:hypothetical protein